MPDWVIDYVLLHELAHLIVPQPQRPLLGAGRPLSAKTERARGYLEGVAAASASRSRLTLRASAAASAAEATLSAGAVRRRCTIRPTSITHAPTRVGGWSDGGGGVARPGYLVAAGRRPGAVAYRRSPRTWWTCSPPSPRWNARRGDPAGPLAGRRGASGPALPVYEVPEPTVTAALAALDGYDQAAVVAADAPDLPGLTVGKLLRPLTSRPVAVAPVEGGGAGLLGVACRLPVPGWLPALRPGHRRAGGPASRGARKPPTWRSRPAGTGCAARPTWPPWTRRSEGWEADPRRCSPGPARPDGTAASARPAWHRPRPAAAPDVGLTGDRDSGHPRSARRRPAGPAGSAARSVARSGAGRRRRRCRRRGLRPAPAPRGRRSGEVEVGQLARGPRRAVAKADRVGEVVVRRAAGPGGPRRRRGRRCPGARCSAAHSAAASRSRRGRSSSPTRAAKVCSAGPPAARRRRNASPRRDRRSGSRSAAALSTTWQTQPSTSASAVSSRASDAFCAGVSSGVKMPSRAIACIDSGLVGSTRPIASSIASRFDRMPARVRLDGVEHVPAQPRHVLEQPLVGGLAQRDVEAHLVLGQLQALAVRAGCWPGSARRCRPGRAAGRCRRRRAPRRRASRAPGRAGRRRARRRAWRPSTASGRAGRAASGGTRSPIAPTIRPATGSQSLRQTSSVL